MKGLKWIMCFIIGILIAGCSKDSALTNGEVCEDFPPLQGSWIGSGYLFSEDRYQFKAPFFNPNDVNEFCYILEDNSASTYSLCKYNLLANENTILVKNFVIINQPKWSKKNWIFFNTLDHSIWKVKSNGDSISKITKNGSDLYPETKYDGTEITFAHTYENAIQEPSIQYISNEHGTILDSLKYSNHNLNWGIIISWSSNNEWVLPIDNGSSYGIGILSLTSNSISQIYSWGFNSGKDEIQDIKWRPNSEEIFYTKWKSGLFKIGTFDHIEVQIKEGCDSRGYEFISISQDGNKLITERVNSYINPEYENAIMQNSKIYLMNIDGSDEHEVVLPVE